MPPVSPGLRWTAACVMTSAALGLAVAFAQTPSASDAKLVYDANCASCHGRDGHGDGPAAAPLRVAPRDFTKGVYKFRSTTSGSLPSEQDLIRTISSGLPGSSMAGWKGRLTDAQIAAVAGYVTEFSPRFKSEKPTTVPLSPAVPNSPESIAKGSKAFENLACAACHGEYGAKTGAVVQVLKDDWGRDVRAADLTEPWTFRGGATAADVFMRLKSGINGTPMPSFGDTAKDPDLWNVANYVVSLSRKPTWKMTADELKTHYAEQDRKALEDPVARGESIVSTLGCAHCHTPVDAEGHQLPGLRLAGGLKIRLAVWGEVVTPNLTSDNETGIGRYSDEDLKRAITRGIRRDDTHMLPFPMGWPAFASLTDADLTALIKYLRTIPPVSNRIPPPSRPNIVSYLSAKFQMLILGREFPLVLFAGNAGSAGNAGAQGAAAGR